VEKSIYLFAPYSPLPPSMQEDGFQEILQHHFNSFEENYDTQYSEKYDKYRIIHIDVLKKPFDFLYLSGQINNKTAKCFIFN
jgi:hypothetical protein